MNGARGWGFVLGAGLVLVTVELIAPYGVVTGILYSLIGALAAAAILLAVWQRRPPRGLAWVLLAAGTALCAVGDTFWFWYDIHALEPLASTADVFYLPSYPVYAAALWRLGKRETTDRGAVIDTAIVGIAAAVLSWVYLLAPYADDTTLTALQRAVVLAYPVGDLILLPLILRLVFAHGGRIRAHVLVLAGMVIVLVADVLYGLGSLAGWFVDGGPIDSMWLLAYVIFAAAAWHPTARTEPPVVRVGASLSGRRLAGLAAASILAPVMILLHGDAEDITVRVAAAASILLFLLVVQRMAGLMRRVRQQSDELERISRTDPLTGVANRRHLDASLNREISRAQRDGSPLSLAILDLDRFKLFNDTFGHPAGDALLQDAVRAWSSELRDVDLLVRFGGEEFIVVLPGCPAGEAEAVVERLRSRIPADQTCSAGVAHHVPGESSADLVARADQALYAAKSKGRDRASVADSLLGPMDDPSPSGRPSRTLGGLHEEASMVIHQCPRCELRFLDTPEVVAHLIDDHNVDPLALERHLSGLPEGTHPRRLAPNPTRAGTSG